MISSRLSADYPFQVTNDSPPVAEDTLARAVLWVRRGLSWCFGFNHDEAVLCFEMALAREATEEPASLFDRIMAHWGIAYAVGPNYNKPWAFFDETELKEVLTKARIHMEQAVALLDELNDEALTKPFLKWLVGSLSARYPQQPNDEGGKGAQEWTERYAQYWDQYLQSHHTMDDHKANSPDDALLLLLAGEALMNLTPWQLWDIKANTVAKEAKTEQAITVLKEALSIAPTHVGVLHLLVHALEMSPKPEDALPYADQLLASTPPDLGHLLHMPSHIYVLCGLYKKSVEANTRAIEADNRFLAVRGALNFYSLYRCHNGHFKIYSAMFQGNYSVARDTSDQLIASLPPELFKVQSPPMADWLESFVSMRQHVFVRFGKWDEIIAQELPADPDLFVVTTAMMHYAKTVAYSATGNVDCAIAQRELFYTAKAKVPTSRMLFNNTCCDILDVASSMLEGELSYRQQKYDEAFAHLRTCIAKDDALPYDEPWGWMQPARHALGALLLEQSRVEEAEIVYREDLGLLQTLPRACQHPLNVWSLHGLHECCTRRQQKRKEDGESAIDQRLNEEIEWLDEKLKEAQNAADGGVVRASCLCRLR